MMSRLRLSWRRLPIKLLASASALRERNALAVKLWRQGVSPSVIAAEIGVSTIRVYQILRAAGLRLRRQKGRKPPKPEHILALSECVHLLRAVRRRLRQVKAEKSLRHLRPLEASVRYALEYRTKQRSLNVHVLPLTDYLFRTRVQPRLPQGYADSLAAFQAKHPQATHGLFAGEWLVQIVGEKHYEAQNDDRGNQRRAEPLPLAQQPRWQRRARYLVRPGT
jgi:hypothetical protein